MPVCTKKGNTVRDSLDELSNRAISLFPAYLAPDTGRDGDQALCVRTATEVSRIAGTVEQVDWTRGYDSSCTESRDTRHGKITLYPGDKPMSRVSYHPKCIGFRLENLRSPNVECGADTSWGDIVHFAIIIEDERGSSIAAGRLIERTRTSATYDIAVFYVRVDCLLIDGRDRG